jgi:hypothetical protein
MKIEEILQLKVNEETTIKRYLYNLLKTLWMEGEGFSGKRPFGKGDWEYDLYKPLIIVGVVEGELDEFDDIEELNTIKADQIIFDCIDYLFGEGNEI